jgi:hypothetical protein
MAACMNVLLISGIRTWQTGCWQKKNSQCIVVFLSTVHLHKKIQTQIVWSYSFLCFKRWHNTAMIPSPDCEFTKILLCFHPTAYMSRHPTEVHDQYMNFCIRFFWPKTELHREIEQNSEITGVVCGTGTHHQNAQSCTAHMIVLCSWAYVTWKLHYITFKGKVYWVNKSFSCWTGRQ